MTMQFDAATHTYKVHGKKLPSVTTILRAVGLVNFDAIPESKRAFYMDRGTANHKLWQQIEEGVDGNFDYDERTEAYRAGHAKFIRETGFKAYPNGIERMVYNTDLGVCGTIDRVGEMFGRPCLIDLKTTKVYPATAIQTAMYALCLPEVEFPEIDRYGCAITNKGAYQLSEKYPDTDENDARFYIAQYHKSKENI